MAKNKNSLNELYLKLDRAIDDGNVDEIESFLNQISIIDTDFIKPEKPSDFAQRIKNINKKDAIIMKRKFNFTKTFAAAAVISIITAASVSGAMLIKQFSFENGNKYYTVNSNQEVSEEKLKSAANIIESDQNTKPAEKIEPVDFNSIDEAEKSLDVKVVFPEIMPDLDLLDIKGNKVYFGENSSKARIWVTYGDINKKLFGITIEKTNINDNDIFNIDSNDMDNGTLQNYTSSKGYKFDKFNESDETGQRTANIFTTYKNNYKYSIVFYNFNNDKMYDIIDSLDLENI